MQEKVSLKSFLQMLPPTLRPKRSTDNGITASQSKARQVSRQVSFRQVTVLRASLMPIVFNVGIGWCPC